MTRIVITGLHGEHVESARLREVKHLCGGRYLMPRGTQITVEFQERSDAQMAVLSLRLVHGIKAGIDEAGQLTS